MPVAGWGGPNTAPVAGTPAPDPSPFVGESEGLTHHIIGAPL